MLEDDDTAKDIATILMASGARGHALGDDGRDSAVHICCENYVRQSAGILHGPDAIAPHGHAMELLQLLCKQQTSDCEVAVSQTLLTEDAKKPSQSPDQGSTENGLSRWLSRFSRQTNFCTFECKVTAPTYSEGATVL